MATERVVQGDDHYGLLPPENEVEVDTSPESEEDPAVQAHEDGSVTVDFSGDKKDAAELPKQHDANIADSLDDDECSGLKSDLIELIDADISARSEWEETYKKGLDLLGVKTEERERPWPGACGVYHPLITEALVRYESQAIMELFPPAGPAKTRIVGAESTDRQKKASRKQEELNYILVEKMTNYRDETEALLFHQGLAGSAFRKVYFDPTMKRPDAKFVPADDLIVPYGESDLLSAPRVTHRQFLTKNQIIKLQKVGKYRKIDLDDADSQITSVSEKEADLDGIKPSKPGDERHEVLEVHVDWDFGEDADGLALPYIITIDRDCNEVLAVYRNWKEGDDTFKKREYFVHYKYLPGLGFYGFGLIHLIGGLTASATSILRQLVDAGTLSNLPGGLKSRGLRIKGDDTPIRPGEFRDVDVPGQSIRDNITFLPYKEPSAVLYQLLGNIVDEGRRIGSIADMQIGDMNAEAPVGTTLALMERALKVMSAIQARNHASMQQELRLIGDIVRDNMGPNYEYQQDEQANRQDDFSSQEDIIPVSDPGATTMAQKVMQMQAVMQMASQAPQVYDIAKLHRSALESLGVKNADNLVPLPDEQTPRDPITENMCVLKGEPVKAFLPQDHQSHIAVHMAALQDPKLQQLIGQSPNAPVIQAALQAHIVDHVAYEYRNQMQQQMGTQLPPPDQPLSPQQEAQLSAASVPAANAILHRNQQDQAQQQAQATMQDPMVQLQVQDQALKQAALSAKKDTETAKLALAASNADQKSKTERSRIAAQTIMDQQRLEQQAKKNQTDAVLKAAEIAAQVHIANKQKEPQ